MALLRAHAKLNLFLRVLAREAGGYHQIETLFCAIELADALRIERAAPGIALEVRGAELGTAEDNLVHRAAVAYFTAVGETPALRIVLDKYIPHGAGLGGGSSDAATTLRALDDLHGGRIGIERLREIGHGLGSDVPFFLGGAPFALAWGRGERMLRVEPPPTSELLIAVPAERVASADAYAALGRDSLSVPMPPAILDVQSLGSWSDIARVAINDFTPLAFARVPVLAQVVRTLVRSGASPALLTGSGSAVFGVFQDGADADRAARALRDDHAGLTLLRSRTLAVESPHAVDPLSDPD